VIVRVEVFTMAGDPGTVTVRVTVYWNVPFVIVPLYLNPAKATWIA
jgi:hypothetical protein